jgi:hypothetical protein
VPMTRTEAAAHARRIRLETATPEQRTAQTHKARLAAAVKAVVDRAPELTDDQRTRLRTIFIAPSEGGGRDGS